MAYYLGVDVGTSYTAAAVWQEGVVEVVPLGERAPLVPSTVLLRENGEELIGEAAERSGTFEPLRVAREFKRRLGDGAPISLDGEPHSAEDLTARLLRWVVETVGERWGGHPAGVAVSHPLGWGEQATGRLRRALDLAGLDAATVVADPEAAAVHRSTVGGLGPGSVVAVYDLGGGTFDTAVLCSSETGWELLGRPQGAGRLGGIDLDEAIFNHVADALGGALDVLDPDDPTALAAVARLRRECVGAKEVLSVRSEAAIPVDVPTLRTTTVRLTRSELEDMFRPALAETVTALDRALRSAGVETSDLTAMLVMGGASRMPLAADLIGALLERPVAVADQPKAGVALGAAVVAAGRDVADAATTSRLAPGSEGREVGSGEAPTRRDPAPAGRGGGGATSVAGGAGGPVPTQRIEGTDRAEAAERGGRDGGPGSQTGSGEAEAGTETEAENRERTRSAEPAATRSLAPVGPLAGRESAGQPGDEPRVGRRRGRALLLVTGGVVAAAVVAVVALTSSGDDPATGRDGTTTTLDEPDRSDGGEEPDGSDGDGSDGSDRRDEADRSDGGDGSDGDGGDTSGGGDASGQGGRAGTGSTVPSNPSGGAPGGPSTSTTVSAPPAPQTTAPQTTAPQTTAAQTTAAPTTAPTTAPAVPPPTA